MKAEGLCFKCCAENIAVLDDRTAMELGSDHTGSYLEPWITWKALLPQFYGQNLRPPKGGLPWSGCGSSLVGEGETSIVVLPTCCFGLGEATVSQASHIPVIFQAVQELL